ncbi:MAG TPA: DNA polymerase III subunit delta [Actinomycetota bacterium]
MAVTSRVTLLWGEDAYLLREEALALLAELDPTEVDGASWQGGELQSLATPSLFGEPRALLLSDARSLPREALDELAGYVASPDPDATLVITCTIAERGKLPVALQKLVEPDGEVRKVEITRKDLEPWIVTRAKAQGVDLAVPAARALVEALGTETGQLVGAIQQLADVYPGTRVGPAEVARQFRGLGEQKTWDLCDRAFGKDLSGAIRSLRSIEEGGDEAIMVLGGIAARLRDLLKVRTLPDRMPPGQVAKEAGLRFDWQARRYQQQARNFSVEELVALHDRITEADRALKSGAPDDVVMPTLVAAIAG